MSVCCECCQVEVFLPAYHSSTWVTSLIEEPHKGGLGPQGLYSYGRQRLTDGHTASSCCESTNKGSNRSFAYTV
jgi:hypothetical protein